MIMMKLEFGEVDPVATCLVYGRSENQADSEYCQKQFRGDSMNDAVLSWTAHVAKDHREDWGRHE